jgi:hypothetical protein
MGICERVMVSIGVVKFSIEGEWHEYVGTEQRRIAVSMGPSLLLCLP